jgi:beta-galactosidase
VDGNGLLYRRGRHAYLAGWPDRALLDRIVPELVLEAGLPAQALPEGLRLRRRGDACFAFNFGPEVADAPAPAGATFVLGDRRLAVGGVAAWKL